MAHQGRCQYENWYYDIQTGERVEYNCERSQLSDTPFCIFHDEHFFETNEKDVQDAFLQEFERETRIDPEIPLCYVGCHIPSVDLNHIQDICREVYFVKTNFHGDINFFDVDFNSISFSNAKFFGNLRLSKINVNNIFLFSKVKFNDKNSNVEFKNCAFKTSEFSLTNFCSLKIKYSTFNFTNFRYAKFLNNLIISECTFSDKTNFSACKFLGNSKFNLTSFYSNAIFQYAKFFNDTKFHNMDFKDQPLVVFNNDLTFVSFLGTDITRIKFEKIIWGQNDRYSIFDARVLIQSPEKHSLSSVLAVIRNLRENYEYHLMYEEAGQFFVKEMELRRIYFEDPNDEYKTKVKEWRQYFSLTNCYNILCQYGESFKRVFSWSICLFVIALVYHYYYPDINALKQSQPLGNIDYASKLFTDPIYHLEISLERTFASFFHINEKGLSDYVVRALSLPILGTLFIVLRRRFERRFRH